MAATLSENIFRCNFVNENVLILIKKIHWTLSKGPIDHMWSLVQVMAWRQKGAKPLHEPMMIQFTDIYESPGLNELESYKYKYRQVSNIRRTLIGNEIVDNSDVVGASPVGAAPTTSSLST